MVSEDPQARCVGIDPEAIQGLEQGKENANNSPTGGMVTS